MSELYNHINQIQRAKFLNIARTGCRRFDFKGGRRSGKTFFILQTLLGRVLRYGEVVNVAVMTGEQGRLGAYADMRTIVGESPSIRPYLEVLTTPKELRCINSGRMFFNSYANSERAKGIACDWLYINEANNFTEQQFIDLSASVRKGVFADRNPNSDCWTERNNFGLIHSTWKDNVENLTPQQIGWFEDLKAKAESPNATSADIAFYKMYYLGEYAEIVGNIFTPANIQVGAVPDGLYSYVAFADPSALRGADYFAMCLGALHASSGMLYILDTFSVNEGGYEIPARKLTEWREQYGVDTIYIETNGLQGIEFFEFAQNSNIPVLSWTSKGNKFERITANYQGITQRVMFADTPQNNIYLQQVYAFDKKCEHDDNIDAVNSLYSYYKWNAML